MKKIDEFYDKVTKVNYDLYTINARELKERLDKTLKLTNLKMAMFNDETRVYNDVNLDVYYGDPKDRLEFDYVKGEILNKEKYSNVSENFRNKRIIGISEEGIEVDKEKEKYHQLGYELLPFAVTVEGRDIKDKEKDVKLLDGFRRMYYMNEIPDVEIFLKVYDILDPSEWQNAMLMFNSWKITNTDKSGRYLDRGYKFGLLTHFGIDVTKREGIYLNLVDKYIGGKFYGVLKDSKVAHKDIETAVEIEYKYISEYKKGLSREEITGRRNIGYMLEILYKHYGLVRLAEYERGTQNNARVITEENVKEFMGSKEMDKHKKKIRCMKVKGHIENYISKHITIHILNYLRDIYGEPPIHLKYVEDCRGYNLKYYFDEVTNEKLEEDRENKKTRIKNQKWTKYKRYK